MRKLKYFAYFILGTVSVRAPIEDVIAGKSGKVILEYLEPASIARLSGTRPIIKRELLTNNIQHLMDIGKGSLLMRQFIIPRFTKELEDAIESGRSFSSGRRRPHVDWSFLKR